MYSENYEERVKQINEEKKQDFIRFALTYFNSFGWNISSQEKNYLLATSPLKEKYLIIPIIQSQENYPTFKEINELNRTNAKVLIISEEFGLHCPLKGSKKYEILKHTASGLQFCYIKNR